MKTLWLLLIIAALVGSPSPSEARSFSREYDHAIKSAVKSYWPDFPFWLAWKAQLYQESRLDPLARSGAGAVGLAQFMPGTWDDTLRLLGEHGDRTSAGLAIQAGAFYMARLRRSWTRDRTGEEKHDLALASYNSGLGHVLSAQSRCGDTLTWDRIAPCLPAITGDQNARQTIGYVSNIHKWWQMMVAE